MTREQVRKIAAGQGGIPIKKFVENPNHGRPSQYLDLLVHHEEETTLLYGLLQEMAQKLDAEAQACANNVLPSWPLKTL